MSSQNLSRAAANLNISDLYRRLPSEIPMVVKLPKFKLEYKQDLQQVLTSMGEIFNRFFFLIETLLMGSLNLLGL